jgi:amidase
VVPLPGGAEEHWYGLSVAGPIARTSADAARMFDVLADTTGPAPEPVTSVALSLRSPSPLARLNHEHRAAAAGAAALLHEGGAWLTRADPPYPLALIAWWTRRWHAGVARDVADLAVEPGLLERRTRVIARKGRRVQRLGGPRAQVAQRWRETALRWFDEGHHDVLVSPAVAGPPVRAGSMTGRGYLSTLALSASRIPYTQAWNLAGLPAVVVPVLVAGRPVGVQLVGRPGSERRLLGAAARIEGRAVDGRLVAAGR